MKKGYYIHFDARRTPGVSKKIDMQMEEFGKKYLMSEICIEAKNVSFIKRLSRLLPGGAVDREYEAALETMKDPDFIYVRRATADKEYINFFRRIKKSWPGCKIIVEIFTYPYDKDEFKRLLTWPYYFKEIYNRKKLPQYIDRYVCFSDDTEIFGVPTIATNNGIRVDDIKVPLLKEKKEDEVNLIAVAFMQKHHGYERVIKGLHQYYQKENKRKVICHLVGDGPEKKRYKWMVKKYGLEKVVIFYPTTLGEQLDKIYEKGDIALSSLGWYKDGVDIENTLKGREYLAKGLPMVSCCRVKGVEESFPFIYQVSNDASPIDIDNLLAFYQMLADNYSCDEMQRLIRGCAKNHVDMPIVMKPIIDFIES